VRPLTAVLDASALVALPEHEVVDLRAAP